MNSHPDKPLLYKISGTWGNHEGSMLLWVAVLALAGGAIAALERRVGARMVAATLAAQAAISLGFYAFLLFASNPFTRLDPPAETGEIGRAHVRTPVTNAHHVCRLLLAKKKNKKRTQKRDTKY